MDIENQTHKLLIQLEDTLKAVYVTKQTTCYDVIKMVAGDERKNYSLVEIAHGMERVLNRKNKVLKVLRSTTSEASFAIRKTNELNTNCHKLTKAFRKLKEMRSLVKQFNGSQTNKKLLFTQTRENFNDFGTKQNLYKDKLINHETSSKGQGQTTQGKVEIMKRFLHDVDLAMNMSLTNIDDIVPSVRLPGDGCSGSPVCPRTRGDGTSHDESFFTSFCSGSPVFPRTLGDGTSNSESFFTSFKHDTKRIHLEPTNDTYTGDLQENHDTAFIEDTDSVLDTESDVSIDELEMNIIGDASDNVSNLPSDVIKRLFSGSDLTTCYADDNAIESFMQTILEQDSDDEGVSSMNSDEGSC